MMDGRFGIFRKTPDCPPPPPNSPFLDWPADAETPAAGDRGIDGDDGEDVYGGQSDRAAGSERCCKATAAELKCARRVHVDGRDARRPDIVRQPPQQDQRKTVHDQWRPILPLLNQEPIDSKTDYNG